MKPCVARPAEKHSAPPLLQTAMEHLHPADWVAQDDRWQNQLLQRKSSSTVGVNSRIVFFKRWGWMWTRKHRTSCQICQYSLYKWCWDNPRNATVQQAQDFDCSRGRTAKSIAEEQVNNFVHWSLFGGSGLPRKHWRDPVTSKPRAIGQCLLAGFTNSFRVETALAPKVCAFPDFSPSWLWHVRIQSCCTGSMPKPSMLFQLTFGRQDGNWHWSCVQESCLEHTPEIKAEASGVCVCVRV